MLTVLQITPFMGAGGAEQTCAPIAAGLYARGDKAILVTKGGDRADDVRRAGGEVIYHDVKTKNPLKIIANAFWLAALIRARKIDIVHARSRAPAWSAYLACRMTGAAYVTTFHAAYKFSNEVKRSYNAVMAKAARVIAISGTVARYIRESYGLGETIRIVPRGIDTDFFDPALVVKTQREALRELWGVEKGKRILFLPARLSPIKGQLTAIEAMGLLQGHDEACLVIAGDAQGREQYEEALSERAHMLHLEGRVRIVPHCADMAVAYALSSVVLVPSRVPEGFGRVPVEAMAMGVPVVASDLGALQETVDPDRGGWLVPAEDPAAWASAIAAALSLSPEEAREKAARARAFVLAHHTKQRMVAATLAVYDEVAPK